jgi:TrmH family RNA methyltransferase
MISSFSNSKIKFIKKLRSKKFRDASNLFYIEGPRIISEAFSNKWGINQVLFSKALIKDSYTLDLVDKLQKENIECLEVDKQIFESFSVKDGPKGVAAIVEQKTFNVQQICDNPGLWVALDRIQDPGNLGSILRTVDAVGGNGVILIDHCTDPFDISSIRGSMGSIFSLQIVKTLSRTFIEYSKENHLTIIGTSDKANKDYQSVPYKLNTVLLMGSEREGLSKDLITVCDKLVCIPMVGRSDSLNLAVATSVCLYEIFNQNRKKSIL